MSAEGNCADEEAVCSTTRGKKPLTSHDKDILNKIFSPSLPYSDVLDDEEVVAEEPEEQDTESVAEAKRLEAEGVQAAEAGEVMTALELFTKSVEAEPDRASGYNNRAQALRLIKDVEGALQDLEKAIELSGGRGTAASQAYTQRGLIRKLEGQDEAALEDFKKASNLGSNFAKHMVISLNPYAALCNKMMAEMIQKAKRGEEI